MMRSESGNNSVMPQFAEQLHVAINPLRIEKGLSEEQALKFVLSRLEEKYGKSESVLAH